MSVAAFHAASRDRALHWPHTMLATSTHDAKRSEDVRARIDVISEMPAAWRLTVRRWSRMNRSHKRTVDGAARADAQRRVPALPDAGRQPARRRARRRSAGRLRRAHRAGDAEVGARVQGGDELDESQRGLRDGAVRLRARAAERRATATSSWPTCRPTLPCSPGTARSTASRWRRSRACRPACPTTTRATSASSCRWSTPTTAGRSTSTAGARLLDQAQAIAGAARPLVRAARAG